MTVEGVPGMPGLPGTGVQAVAGLEGLPGAQAPLYAALVCVGAAAWLLGGREDAVRRARLLLAGGGAIERGPHLPRLLERGAALVRARLKGPRAHAWWCLLGGAALSLLAASWLPLAGGAAAVLPTGRWLRLREGRRSAERREAAVVELCGAVSGELRVGRPPDRALLSAGGVAVRELGEEGAALLAAARFGGDVPGALREAARRPGAEGLSGVAACWQVSVEGGTALAEGLDRVAGALRAQRDQREELHAQLAGPRSTAVVLALLPAFGLLLGGAMGADPLTVLLHSPAGLACLVAGGLLEWAGLAWVARLVRAAEEPGGSGGSGRRAET